MFDEFPKNGASGFHGVLQPEDWFGYIERSRPRQPHNANSTTPRRRGNRNNRVVDVHAAIVAVKLGQSLERDSETDSAGEPNFRVREANIVRCRRATKSQ